LIDNWTNRKKSFNELFNIDYLPLLYYYASLNVMLFRKGGKRLRMRVGAMTWKVITGLGMAIILSVCVALAVESDRVKMAQSSAESWLALVDQSRYAVSWDEAALYFKGTGNQGEWQETLQAMREPLGKVISREVKTKSYHTSLPGAPDGEYVVIQFETRFANKKSAIETVTPMLDKDGSWRVSGYFIK
jgi:hypothetical protein